MKRTLTGIAAAAMVLGTMAPAAFASTSNTLTSGGDKTISLDGTTLYSGVQVGNALDSGTTTTYFPIWYLQQALNKGGYTNTYNPTTKTWDITMPGVNASTLTVDGGVGTGNAAISINGTVVKKFNAQWAPDLAGGKNASVTTYFPVYYLGNVLAAAGFTNAWDGNSFGFKSYVATPAVSSITELNAKQVAVVFNQAVDQTTAGTLSNYTIQRTSDTTAKTLDTVDPTASASLQSDGKTVIITATNDIAAWAVASGTAYTFGVSGVNTAKGATVPSYSSVLTNSDSTAPTFVSATATAKDYTNTVTLTFSEPVVATSGIVKINGTVASVAAGSTPDTLTVTTGSSLAAGSSNTVEVLDFTDYAGNLQAQTDVNSSFSVVTDTAAPVVSNVTVKSDDIIEVTFSKAVDATSVANGIKLLDGNGTSLAGNISSILATDSTDTVYDITLNNTGAGIPFNSSNVFSGTLVFANSIVDTLGNTMASATRAVSITKDTVAPSVASVTFVKPDGTGSYHSVSDTNGAIVVKYNENIAKLATTATGVVVVDQNGAPVANLVDTTAVGNAQVDAANDPTALIIPLSNAVSTTTTALTVHLPSGFVKDTSLTGNGSTASVNTLSVSSGASVSDSTAPVVATAVGNGASPNTITLTVTEAGSGLNYNSALNLNDYRLDGAPLPTGTYATITDAGSTYTITLNLPVGTISSTRTNYALNVSGISDVAGNVMAPQAFNTISLKNDTQPTLKAAKLNSDGTITATFSEAVTGGVPADFAVKLNGFTLATASGYTVTDITSGADNGSELIKIPVAIANAGASASIYVDVNGDGAYTAGTDILIATGNYATASAYNGGFIQASDVKSLTIGTAASGITGHDGDGNTFATSGSVTVK